MDDLTTRFRERIQDRIDISRRRGESFDISKFSSEDIDIFLEEEREEILDVYKAKSSPRNVDEAMDSLQNFLDDLDGQYVRKKKGIEGKKKENYI